MNILKELRTKKGVYQKDVAEYLGVDRTTYVKYENGDSSLSPDVLIKLSDYFEVSTDYILGKTEPPKTLDEQLEGIDFALYDAMQHLTDEKKKDLLKIVEYMKEKGSDNN